MPKMISNSSCLIALDNINMSFILRECYEEIIVAEEVQVETITSWLGKISC